MNKKGGAPLIIGIIVLAVVLVVGGIVGGAYLIFSGYSKYEEVNESSPKIPGLGDVEGLVEGFDDFEIPLDEFEDMEIPLGDDEDYSDVEDAQDETLDKKDLDNGELYNCDNFPVASVLGVANLEGDAEVEGESVSRQSACVLYLDGRDLVSLLADGVSTVSILKMGYSFMEGTLKDIPVGDEAFIYMEEGENLVVVSIEGGVLIINFIHDFSEEQMIEISQLIFESA